MPLSFPEPYVHDHPPVMNVNDLGAKEITRGERAADTVAEIVGSWKFIIVQSILLVCWVALNVLAWYEHWDPYPFILLNLFLSLQAAYTAPMLMMSQNRQAGLDRLRAEHDFRINVKAEEEIRYMLLHLEAQNKALLELLNQMNELKARVP